MNAFASLMNAFASLMDGFGTALTPGNLLWAAIGVPLGTAIGVLPGRPGDGGGAAAAGEPRTRPDPRVHHVRGHLLNVARAGRWSPRSHRAYGPFTPLRGRTGQPVRPVDSSPLPSQSEESRTPGRAKK